MEGFFQKELPEEFFMGETFGENLKRGYREGRMFRSYQGRGRKMQFPITGKSIKCKSFPQPCWDIYLKIKPCQEFWKDLLLS